MYFLNPIQVENALQRFREIEISDSENGDSLFSEYGPGNIGNRIDKPYERFSDYENLLRKFCKDDPEKYQIIHKGTPFYFLAWTAYDLKNFEKALFYMDAAISEDMKNSNDWLQEPAAMSFYRLQSPQVAQRVTKDIESTLDEEIRRFKSVSNRNSFTRIDFIQKFVEPLLTSAPEFRTIVTAFYTFLLEFKERIQELKIRSTEGGSVEPFITHLFKGGLIFESLLKIFYQKSTLGRIFQDTGFKQDFLINVSTSHTSLNEVSNAINADDMQTAFETIVGIRNTTGHNLVWDDIFSTETYTSLYQQEINAIFYIISKKHF